MGSEMCIRDRCTSNDVSGTCTHCLSAAQLVKACFAFETLSDARYCTLSSLSLIAILRQRTILARIRRDFTDHADVHHEDDEKVEEQEDVSCADL